MSHALRPPRPRHACALAAPRQPAAQAEAQWQQRASTRHGRRQSAVRIHRKHHPPQARRSRRGPRADAVDGYAPCRQRARVHAQRVPQQRARRRGGGGQHQRCEHRRRAGNRRGLQPRLWQLGSAVPRDHKVNLRGCKCPLSTQRVTATGAPSASYTQNTDPQLLPLLLQRTLRSEVHVEAAELVLTAAGSPDATAACRGGRSLPAPHACSSSSSGPKPMPWSVRHR